MARPAPPIRKLAQLRDIECEYVSLTFKQDYNWALQFKGMEWEPRLFHADVYTLWARAVEGRATVPLWAVKLDTGWVAEVCLDQEKAIWVEIIPKGSQPHDEEAHNQAQNSALSDVEKRCKAIETETTATLLRLGGIPIGETTSGEYTDVLPDGKLPKRQPRQPEGTETEDASTDDHGDDTQGAADAAASPDYASLFQQLKARMREEGEE
jgi:hypothetical protein